MLHKKSDPCFVQDRFVTVCTHYFSFFESLLQKRGPNNAGPPICVPDTCTHTDATRTSEHQEFLWRGKYSRGPDKIAVVLFGC